MIPLFLFVVLGISQGILEWLPVSSEGQIFFVGTLFGVEDQSLLLSIAFWIHFGTMISVLFLFRDEWIQILDLRKEDPENIRKFLIITTIGTAITGIPIKLFLLELTTGEQFGLIVMILLGIALLITAGLLKLQQLQDVGLRDLATLTAKESLIIGMAQGLSIIPGVSRSGTTVSVLLFHKIETDDSFRGSFFMSVPAVAGAIVLDLFDYIRGESTSIIAVQPIGIVIAIVFAAIFGIITMKLLLNFAKEIDFFYIVMILAVLVFIYVLFVVLI